MRAPLKAVSGARGARRNADAREEPQRKATPLRWRLLRRLLWILLLVLLAVAGGLVAYHGGYGGTQPLRLPTFSDAVLDIGIVIFVAGMLLTAFRRRLSEALEAALVWLLIAVLVLVGYTYRVELREAVDKVWAQLMPGHAASQGRSVELVRGRNGNFRVITEVNGARVVMMFDTGASAVILTEEAAKAAGLPLEFLAYTVSLETANGRTRAAPVTLDRLVVGSIDERAVPALVVPSGRLNSNLLGMSFLNRLDSWNVKGDRLQLRAR